MTPTLTEHRSEARTSPHRALGETIEMTTKTTFKLSDALDHANERGVGQFHVVVDGRYYTTWHSYGTACAVAEKRGGVVYNMDKKKVWSPGSRL